MENQDSPPLDPTLAPALLFFLPGHGGADEAGEETTEDDDGTRFLYSIPKRRLLAVSGLDYLDNDATWITPQGWVLVLDPRTRDASLHDPFTSRTLCLPADQSGLLPSNEHTRCLLSTPRPADDPGCIVIIVDLEEPVLWYCSPGGSRWLRHEYPSHLNVGDHYSIMTAMDTLTAVRGKFYAYFFPDRHHQIIALEFSPGPIFSSTRIEWSPMLSRGREFRLVESCGDLFFLHMSLEYTYTQGINSLEPLCAQGITEIYVYKLVLSSNNAWVKVRVATLGDNRVFLSGSDGAFGTSMAADEVGLKADCIYFTLGADKGLYVHDLERGTTTLHNPGTDVPDSVNPVFLMHANDRQYIGVHDKMDRSGTRFLLQSSQDTGRSMENTSSAAATTTQEPGWSSLPGDLLKTILDLLPWSSQPSFGAVCKHWRSVVSPFYSAWLTPVLLNAADISSTNLRYYSPYHHKIFEVSFKLDTPNAKICSTRGRYHTVCQRAYHEYTVAHIDLVTSVIYDLFPLNSWFDFIIYDGERRRMYGIKAFQCFQMARAMQSDSGGWYPWKFTELILDEPTLEASPMTNPVHHRGLLYLLGANGRLAVYDDDRHEEGLRLLDKPQGFSFDCDDDVSYLFESDEGELMAMLMGCRGTPVHVLKLNEEEMQWEKVDSLQGRALFTGTPTTIMVKTNVKWMQNKIFVPRLHDWPETLHVEIVERGGEVAFVPISTTTGSVSQDAGGTGIWSCGLGHQESSEFWETMKLDYSVWVDFKN